MEIGERFRDFVPGGEESLAGKTTVILRATDELGNPAQIFFDKDSKLMLGTVIQNPFSSQPEQIRTVFNEWKQVGKLKLPSQITVTDKARRFRFEFS